MIKRADIDFSENDVLIHIPTKKLANEENVCGRFLEEEILEIRQFGDGHINDTFLVKTQKEQYICQRIRE